MEAQCVLYEAQTELLHVVQSFSLYSWLVALLLVLLSQPPLHALPGSSVTDQFSSIMPRCSCKPHKVLDNKTDCSMHIFHHRIKEMIIKDTHTHTHTCTSHKIAGYVCHVSNYNCSKYRQIALAQHCDNVNQMSTIHRFSI